jgi:hypothetical protein
VLNESPLHEEVRLQLYVFLTLAIDGSDWPTSSPGRFIPVEKTPRTPWIGNRVDLKAVLGAVEKAKYCDVYAHC